MKARFWEHQDKWMIHVIAFFHFSDIALHSLSFKVSVKTLNGYMIRKNQQLIVNENKKKYRKALDGNREQVHIPTFI